MTHELAIAALSQWDNPAMFEDKALYVEVSTLLGLLNCDSADITKMTSSQRELFDQLYAGVVESISNTIKSCDEEEAATLVATLEDLLALSDAICKKSNSH